MNDRPDPERMRLRPCPNCGKPGDRAFRPFCSKRCAQIDLHRWLSGRYVIPTSEEDTGGGPDDADRA